MYFPYLELTIWLIVMPKTYYKGEVQQEAGEQHRRNTVLFFYSKLYIYVIIQSSDNRLHSKVV